jgi:hypothetical protein
VNKTILSTGYNGSVGMPHDDVGCMVEETIASRPCAGGRDHQAAKNGTSIDLPRLRPQAVLALLQLIANSIKKVVFGILRDERTSRPRKRQASLVEVQRDQTTLRSSALSSCLSVLLYLDQSLQ